MGEFDELAAQAGADELAAFGEPVTFHGAGLPDVSTAPDGTPLLGIFDPHFLLVEVSDEDGAEVQTRAPAVFVLLEHLALPPGRSIEEQDEITVRGQRWGIQRDEHDHVGGGRNLVLFEKP